MPRGVLLLLTGTAGVLLLAGCSESKVAAKVPEDAAIVEALADPIMSDPDLTSQNAAGQAIVAAGPVSAAPPPIDRSDETIEQAREDAARLVGAMIGDPSDAGSGDARALRDAVTAMQTAKAAGFVPAKCLNAVEYTARWAAALPGPLQVYPRGAVEEAAGTNAAGCGLRVVRFRTPVPASEVVAFYEARLRAARYEARHEADGEDHILRGGKLRSRYLIYIRKSEEGLTAVDTVVAG